MRKLLVLFTLMLTLSAQAQQQAEPQDATEPTHMKFMGIPMDCDAETFAKRLMKEKGLVKGNFADTDRPTLKGRFSGYDDCFFIIYAEDGGNVSNVGVIMQKQLYFSSLLSQYDTLKKRLMTKYGNPDEENEGFKDYEPSTDAGRMRELKEGNANFECTYFLKEGVIKLMMTAVDYFTGYIQMFYFDVQNTLKANDKNLEDL